MFSTLKIYGFTNVGLMNSKMNSYINLVLSALKSISYFPYLTIGKLQKFIPASDSRPPLFNHISRIVQRCSSEQMVRVATRRIVATVKGFKSFRNWLSSVDCERNPVRQQGLFKMLNLSITSFGFAAFPFPTLLFGGDIYVIPKSLFKRWCLGPPFNCSIPAPLYALLSRFHVLIIGDVI